MIKKIYKHFKFLINKNNFKLKNKHNDINLQSYYPVENIIIGKYSYGDLNIRSYNYIGKITIGNYCSIADNVEFLIGGEHDYKRISTFPFQTRIYKQKTIEKPNYDITIEDDVWIGYDCLIMSNAHIGKGSVIGARSIVLGDIPPYSIYVGNKVIKKRFSDKIINEIEKINFYDIEHSLNDEYAEFCQREVTNENLKKIIDKFNKRD